MEYKNTGWRARSLSYPPYYVFNSVNNQVDILLKCGSVPIYPKVNSTFSILA